MLEDGGWSWFEDAEVAFSTDGSTLLTSAVTGVDSTASAPGTVVLAQLDLASGTRSLVDLGQGEPDDHSSASILETTTREVLTAWSRHQRDRLAPATATPTRRVNGTYTPLPGDYDGLSLDDIHWYAPGTAPDYLWWSSGAPVALTEPAAINL